MTRYARGKGSKGCNKKQENTPFSWHLLKAQSFSKNAHVQHESVSSQDCERRQERALPPESGNNELWFDFCANRKDAVLCGKVRKLRSDIGSHSEKKNRDKIVVKSKEVSGSRVPVEGEIEGHSIKTTAVTKKDIFGDKVSFNGSSLPKIERNRVSTMITRKNNAGRKFKIDLSEEDRKDLRRKEKALKREKKKVCFCCRRWGHQLADCPEFKPIGSSDVSPPAGGLCYQCGSTEHNVNQCSKYGANSHKFARCFVCGEDGHLARQCQDNPKGKYPKGGACRYCGETSHLCNECPKGASKTTEPKNILSCATEGPVDSIPEDVRKHCQQNTRSKKIIQF